MPTGPDSGVSGHVNQVYLIVLLGSIALAGAADIVFDAPTTWRDPHLLLEGGVLAFCIASAAWLGRGWMRERRSLDRLQESLASHQNDTVRRQIGRGYVGWPV